jgi:hypothetical protein
MNWKKNLANAIDKSGYSDREIYGWTGMSTSLISNMSTQKHESLKVEQFLKLKLLFKKEHEQFVYEIFGKEYFSSVKTVKQPENLTELGQILTDQYNYEKLPKKELSKASGVISSRIDYIVDSEDSTIKIDEITKLEISMSLPLGTLVKKRFSKIKLNTKKQYEALLKELREK